MRRAPADDPSLPGVGEDENGYGSERYAMKFMGELAALCAAGIVGVWILYPLTVAALARVRRRTSLPGSTATGDPSPMVSVIIATRDHADALRERIQDCLRAMDGVAQFEVVIAIDRSATAIDGETLQIEPNVSVVLGDAPGGKAPTINAAVRSARGDLLVFTDSRQRFEPGAIAKLVAAFADPRVGAASGRLELGAGASRSVVGRYWSYERWLRRCEAALHSCVGTTGAIWALRRTLWHPLPARLILDDVYAPMRVVLAGHRVVFVDDARAIDTRRAEPRKEYQRKVRTLTGVLQLCAWLPQLLVPGRNPIWTQFMFHKLLRLLTPYWLIGILAWPVVWFFRLLESQPHLATIPMVGVTALATMTKSRVGRAAREIARWGIMLQAAVVVAVVNGVRRQWDVWRG